LGVARRPVGGFVFLKITELAGEDGLSMIRVLRRALGVDGRAVFDGMRFDGVSGGVLVDVRAGGARPVALPEARESVRGL
jgi:hypothetical protein